jgi:hypothetical protein
MDTDLSQYDPDAEQARRQRAAADQANKASTLVDDLRWVMSSPRGRRFVAWLLEFSGVRRPSFHNSGSVTAFNEGQRNVGQAVLGQVEEHCFDNYLKLLEEQRAFPPKKETAK